jgi:SulP family sulfate permease
LAVTLSTARISSRIPGAFIGLIAVFHLQSRGVNVLCALLVELPHLGLPSLPGAREIGHLVPLPLAVAMVCIMQTSAVASTFPSEKVAAAEGVSETIIAAVLMLMRQALRRSWLS